MYDLSGKVALVTGASGERGIGRATALRLAQEGADVVVNDVGLQREGTSGYRGLPAVVEEIEALGRQSLAVVADIADPDQVQSMVDQTLERFGQIDILINNAAALPGNDRIEVVNLEQSAFDHILKINLTGTFLVSRAVAREMIKRGAGGSIVNISSVAGLRTPAKFAAYGASKWGLIGFTQALARELAEHGVTVNVICPGLTNTERVRDIAVAVHPPTVTADDHLASMLEQAAKATPLGRVVEPEDVARTTVHLVTSEGAYLTGLAVPVCGGAHMH